MTTYRTRAEMLEAIQPHSVIAEIGVFRGEFADVVLEKCMPSKLVLVDLWTGRFGSGDKDGRNHIEIPNMEATYLDLCRKYHGRQDVILIRANSALFFERWESGFFDAVYIDADHSYDSVFRDLAGAMRTLKPGGLLMGHDYHGAVRQAVDDFCVYHHLNVDATASDGCPSFLIRLPNPIAGKP